MSYGKFFASAFSGSMVGSGPDVFAIWGYVISHTIDGQVELNPMLLAAIIGTTAERIDKAIDTLCSPDSRSRNKEHEGRRLIREGEYAYKVVSHSIYREMRNEDDRRAYNRQKKRESRERQKDSVNNVNDSHGQVSSQCAVSHGQPRSAQAESEAKADTETSKKEKKGKQSTTFSNKPDTSWKAGRQDTHDTMRKSFLDPEATVFEVLRFFRACMDLKGVPMESEWREKTRGQSAVEVFDIFANAPEGSLSLPSYYVKVKSGKV